MVLFAGTNLLQNVLFLSLRYKIVVLMESRTRYRMI